MSSKVRHSLGIFAQVDAMQRGFTSPLDLGYRWARLSERLLMGIVWRLPRAVIYWAVVRAAPRAR